MNARWRRLGGAALVAASLLAGGCATVQPGALVSKDDPWEGFNRKVYAFNDTVDEAVLKPVATAYRNVVPQLVRTGIDNVLGNIGDVWSAANQFLQGKVQQGMDMSLRVVTNTIVGLGGLLDPATEMGLVRRSEDFGQTLGHWGVRTRPLPRAALPGALERARRLQPDRRSPGLAFHAGHDRVRAHRHHHH
jgi:phospholipid-binding lipoprotein MlaA